MQPRQNATEKQQRMHRNENTGCPHCTWTGKRKKLVRHLEIHHDISREDALVAAGMKQPAHELEPAIS